MTSANKAKPEVTILEAIWAAQEVFAPIFKNEKNEHLNSKYANLASTLAAVAPALRAHGILYLRSYDATENALVTTFRHMESGTESNVPIPLPTGAHERPQTFRAACTYAARTGLEIGLGLSPEDDDGTGVTAGMKAQRAAEEKARLEEAAAQAAAAARTKAEEWAADFFEKVKACATAEEASAMIDKHKAHLNRLEGKFPKVAKELEADFTDLLSAMADAEADPTTRVQGEPEVPPF